MNQPLTEALLQNLVEENQADGALILVNVGGKVVTASVGKMDFSQTLTAFASACAQASS